MPANVGCSAWKACCSAALAAAEDPGPVGGPGGGPPLKSSVKLSPAMRSCAVSKGHGMMWRMNLERTYSVETHKSHRQARENGLDTRSNEDIFGPFALRLLLEPGGKFFPFFLALLDFLLDSLAVHVAYGELVCVEYSGAHEEGIRDGNARVEGYACCRGGFHAQC